LSTRSPHVSSRKLLLVLESRECSIYCVLKSHFFGVNSKGWNFRVGLVMAPLTVQISGFSRYLWPFSIQKSTFYPLLLQLCA
jgi:hypothetical protein